MENCRFSRSVSLENEADYLWIAENVFLPETRGQIGSRDDGCVFKRKDFGFEIVIWKRCLYAWCPKLYKKVGFEYINVPWVVRDMSLSGLDVEEIIVMNEF
jgi:hypothetical protein